jgi:hypothetical protein
MIQYLLTWLNAYLVHFGGWMTFICGCHVYKNGIPKIKTMPKILKAALLISLVLGLFSSHAHMNYLKFFTNNG